MKNHSRHCNALVIGHCGILIEGESGAGKSSLTLGLLERAAQSGIPASLVSDDRTIVEACKGALIARTPDQIAGKIELRGHGIVDHPYTTSVEVHLVVRMADDFLLERLPEQKNTEIKGIDLPVIEVPVRHEQAAQRIVFAWLNDNPGFNSATVT
ncbi:MAG: HPr kinase/phosphatase C-terminal domain-containing protein [Pseudomonadota bacterium]